MATQVLNQAELLRLVEKHPCMPMAEMGRRLGVSRERIRQKVRQSALNIPKGQRVKWRVCTHCGSIFHAHYRKIFCSDDCQYLEHRIPVACEVCGKIVHRLKSQVLYQHGKRNYNHAFCSNKCKGHWLGTNYPAPNNRKERNVIKTSDTSQYVQKEERFPNQAISMER